MPAAATAEDSPPPRATPAAQAPPPTTQASPAMHQDCMAEDRLAVALKVRAKVLKNGATAKEILTAPRGAMKTAARFDARGLKTRLNFFSLLLHPDKHAGVRRSLHRSTGTFVPAVAGERPAIAPRLPRDCPRTFPAHAIARALRHALTLCPARRGALLRRRAQVSDAETALWTNAFDKVKSAYDELVAALPEAPPAAAATPRRRTQNGSTLEWGCRCKSVCRVWLSLRCVSMVYQTVFLDRPDQNGG